MSEYVHCNKCLTSRTGDVLGAPCRTPGCDGVIEAVPDFSTLVDDLPERMTCGRREPDPTGVFKFGSSSQKDQDYWQKFKTNGDRVCSYCGSLHPDDFLALVKACADAPDDAAYGSVPEIEQSDKGYKIYVHRSGVRNAHEGGIKFYTCHLPRNAEGKIDLPLERHDEYKRAVRAASRRFNIQLYGETPQPQRSQTIQ